MNAALLTREGSVIKMNVQNLAHEVVDHAANAEAAAEAEFTKGSSFELGLHLDGVPLIGSFVDRPLQMEQIRGKLLPHAESQGRQVMIIHGEAGVGKSQLSFEFARQYAREFNSTFWVDGSSEERLTWDIAALQHHLKGHVFSQAAQSYAGSPSNLSCAVQEVLQWFSLRGNHRWLLIVDNLATESHLSGAVPRTYRLEPYLPAADQGQILITSRGTDTQQYGSPLKLEVMDIHQVEILLAAHTGRASEALGQPDRIKDLLELLGRHPTAVTLAAAFLVQTNSSIPDYLEQYRRNLSESSNPQNLPPETSPNQTRPNDSVLVTTTLSYQHISQEDETAASFLKLWTYLDNRDLWYELFTPDFPLPVESVSLWWFRSAIQSRQRFAKAMHTLQAYGIIQETQNSSGYFLHPVVSEWAMQTISKKKDPELAWLAVRTVGRVIPNDPAKIDRISRLRLRPHADACYRLAVDKIADQYFTLKNPFLPKGVKLDTALIYASAVYRLGHFYGDMQMTVEANDLLLRASHGYSEILGAEDAVTLDASSSRARVLVAGGKLDEAEEVYLELLTAYEHVLGPGASLTSQAAYSLASVQQQLGKLDRAEGTYRRVLSGLESTVGRDHPLTIRLVGALGAICLEQKRLNEAGEFFLRALPVHRTARSFEYVMLLISIRRLALAYLSAGSAAEAEKMAIVCLEEHGLTSLSDGSLYLATIVAIGELYQKQGQLAEAERLFLRALDGYERTPVNYQNEIANTAYNLANFYAFQDKLEEAGTMVLKAVQGYTNTLGADHHYTLDALNNLANILDQQGKKSEAEKTHLQVLESKERTLGSEHRKTLETVNNMGVFYAGQDRFVEAEEMYLRALKGYQTLLGPTRSITLSVYINMGSLYSRQGRRIDALRAYLQALDGYEEVSLRFQKTIDASPASGLDGGGRNHLYAQYSDEGDGAFSTFIPGLKMTLTMLGQLANLQVRNREWLEAEDAYLRLAKGREIAFGLDHSSVEDTLGTLSAVLYYRCFEEVPIQQSASQETTDPTQDSIGCWAEASPVWRLAHLARTYGQSYPLLFGVLGKALKHVGDEYDAQVALQLEVMVAMNRTGGLRRSCDRCETSVTPETGRYVCKSCHEDTDLCEPCFKTREDEQWQSHPCYDHEFQVVFSSDSRSDEVSRDCDDPAAWLSDLQLHYAARAPEEEAAAAAAASGGDE